MLVIHNDYEIDDLAEYSPKRAGARETWDKICEADRGREFVAALAGVYPNGIDEWDFEQLLDWEEKDCLELAGMGQKQGEDNADNQD